MALELSYQVCLQECCKQIQITDTTYLYSVDNLGGWGYPNDLRSSVVSATLLLTDPNSVDYTIDITAEVLADDVIVITSDEIGLTADTEIPSGIYYFTITVDTGTEYTFDITKLFYCTEEKRFHKLMGEYNPTDCGCGCSEDKTLEKILDIWTYLQVLKDAACCGKTDKFTELLEIINTLLGDNPCSNC